MSVVLCHCTDTITIVMYWCIGQIFATFNYHHIVTRGKSYNIIYDKWYICSITLVLACIPCYKHWPYSVLFLLKMSSYVCAWIRKVSYALLQTIKTKHRTRANHSEVCASNWCSISKPLPALSERQRCRWQKDLFLFCGSVHKHMGPPDIGDIQSQKSYLGLKSININ